jgi:hypothetical protein
VVAPLLLSLAQVFRNEIFAECFYASDASSSSRLRCTMLNPQTAAVAAFENDATQIALPTQTFSIVHERRILLQVEVVARPIVTAVALDIDNRAANEARAIEAHLLAGKEALLGGFHAHVVNEGRRRGGLHRLQRILLLLVPLVTALAIE